MVVPGAARRVLFVWIAAVAAVLVARPEDAVGQHPNKQSAVAEGRKIFRFDTFGDEQFWTGELKLHEVIQTQMDPLTALALGLNVDSTRLPRGFLATADLTDPATTVELLRRDAVLGLNAKVVTVGKSKVKKIARIGITCALCHSVADDSVGPGIGRRRDGWPNRDLDVGRIISLSPAITDEQRAVYQSWGPGRHDPYFNQDGLNIPVLIPPAYELRNVPLETFLGVGRISYWNAYVAVTQMHGRGTFVEPRLGINIRSRPDLVTPKLQPLLKYQLSLLAPGPGLFDPAAASRGAVLFGGKADCARCHIPPTFTDAPTLHDPAEIPTNAAYATRPASITQKWRTTPLRGLSQHPPYFHDGSAETLAEVIDIYDVFFALGLTLEEKADLEQFLRIL